MKLNELLAKKAIKVQLKNLPSEERGYSLRHNGSWNITINKNDSAKRKNFTIAHEYFEIELFNRLDLSLDKKHDLANELASEHLLPIEIFRPALNTHNLLTLKEIFPDVSHEVIARRMCQFIPIVVTIFDNTTLTSRFGSDNIKFPKVPVLLEYDVMRIVFKSRD